MDSLIRKELPSFQAFLEGLEGYQGQISSKSFFPKQKAEMAKGKTAFSEIEKRLQLRLYAHQLEALRLIEEEKHVVIATPTASGKSLCYQLPSIQALQRQQTVLYLFPTKALSHDQLGKFKRLAPLIADSLVSYDGDTPTTKRASIRERATGLYSNPDMIHYSILPYHEKWAGFLSRLKYIVIDEVHSYRGVMGIHVANILRRLLRMARHYGAEPQMIAASATISNPAAHSERLTGQEFSAVTLDYSPRAAREFVFWQPPKLDSEGRRRSANSEAAYLAAHFMKARIKSIFFCNSRKGVELVRRYAQARLNEEEAALLQTYRAGYTAEDRRSIEEGFKRGDSCVLVSTSALELGVDIGGVDAVVMVGYPGSMTALWQRVGRAGRAGERALAVLIADNNPLDEYYLQHPDLITEGKVESAIADAFNREIHPLHVACAAYEKPIKEQEGFVAEWLEPVSASKLVKRKNTWHYLGRYPHKAIQVRGTGGKQVVLKDAFGKTIGISDYQAALRDLHPGAVYLHQGDTFVVCDLDLEAGKAVLLPHIEDYYTQTRFSTDIEILAQDFSLRGIKVGRVRVSTDYDSFVKKRYVTEAVIDERVLDLPEVSYTTQALWFSLHQVALSVSPADLPAAMHALEHCLIGLLPVFILCERADIGGVSYSLYPATAEPLIFIYDGYPGGVGYTRAAATLFPEWLKAAIDLLQNCACKQGCPRCILSPKCGNGNQILDKKAALVLAKALLSQLDEGEDLALN